MKQTLMTVVNSANWGSALSDTSKMRGNEVSLHSGQHFFYIFLKDRGALVLIITTEASHQRDGSERSPALGGIRLAGLCHGLLQLGECCFRRLVNVVQKKGPLQQEQDGDVGRNSGRQSGYVSGSRSLRHLRPLHLWRQIVEQPAVTMVQMGRSKLACGYRCPKLRQATTAATHPFFKPAP
jgi:hypothetical protein